MEEETQFVTHFSNDQILFNFADHTRTGYITWYVPKLKNLEIRINLLRLSKVRHSVVRQQFITKQDVVSHEVIQLLYCAETHISSKMIACIAVILSQTRMLKRTGGKVSLDICIAQFRRAYYQKRERRIKKNRCHYRASKL